MNHTHIKKLSVLTALLLLVLSLALGCESITTPTATEEPAPITSLELQGEETIYLYKGYTYQLETNIPEAQSTRLTWATAGDAITLTSYGFVTAKEEGTAVVTVMADGLMDSVTIVVLPDGGDPTVTLPPATEIPTATQHPTEVPDETVAEAPTSASPELPTEAGAETSTAAPDDIATEVPTVAPTEAPTESPTETPTEAPTEQDTLPPIDYEARDKFYNGADPADSYEEALERSQNYELSGATRVPDQAPVLSAYMPMTDGAYIRNNEPYYADENTYVVVNAYGQEVFRVYRGGGYITLEEVAAYVYAFGDVPANYTSSKSTRPTQSGWGEYLRVNNTAFSGNTSKYPYEPVLPRISGCGGDLYYYEIDIGTTGTDCDPKYPAALYNNGYSITRGAARIVYTRYDANHNNIIDPNEKFLFYTYNHYNDFQEYLNYYGGWGEMFGNITGGGTISSKYDYNPTPYVPIVMGSLKNTSSLRTEETRATILWYDFRHMSECLAWDKSRFAA